MKLEELLGVEVPKHRQTTFIKFTAALQHNFKQGSIQVSEKLTIAAKSSLEGLDQTFQIGAQAKFTLFLANKQELLLRTYLYRETSSQFRQMGSIHN